MRVLVQHREVGRDCDLVPRLAPKENLLLGEDAVVGAKPLSFGVERAAPDDGLGPRPARSLELCLDEKIEPHAGGFGGTRSTVTTAPSGISSGRRAFAFAKPDAGHDGHYSGVFRGPTRVLGGSREQGVLLRRR